MNDFIKRILNQGYFLQNNSNFALGSPENINVYLKLIQGFKMKMLPASASSVGNALQNGFAFAISEFSHNLPETSERL